MKIRTLSKVSTGLLLLVAVVLSLSAYWGMEQLRRQVESSRSFSEYRAFVNDHVAASINAYLRSGDATDLSGAGSAIHQLDELIMSDSRNQLGQFHDLLIEFAEFMASEARAAGKLAGNEEGLLIQNERETRDGLSSLINYSEEGQEKNAGLAAKYRKAALDLLLMLQDRTFKRQQANVTDETGLQDLENINRKMLQQAESIESMERIGIYNEAEVDDFAALMGLESDSSDKEEKADEITANISSLIKRFPKELRNTADIQRRIKQSYSRIEDYVQQIKKQLDHAEQQVATEFEGTLHTARNAMISVVVMILIFSVSIDQIQRGISRRISEFVPYFQTYAMGDFRETVIVSVKTSELKSLRDCANILRESLAGLLMDIKDRSGKVLDIGLNVSEASEHVAVKMENQMQQAASVSTAMQQMTGSFNEVAEHAAKAAETAQDISRAAADSSIVMREAIEEVRCLAEQVNETSEDIGRLGAVANNINAVLEVISGIAEQTNLLALNAAIEAARAGEHGRGFAVVADEVRSLSQRTASSTQEIREIIGNIQGQAVHCVGAMESQVQRAQVTVRKSVDASESMQNIVDSIALIRDMTTQIAVTTEEQAAVAEDINRNIQNIREINEETRNSSHDTASMSQQLQRENRELQEALTRFSV
ncbi:hypothetical protein BTA51_05365 [Hahella sp. CCB-MM4]|uniref:methyl-accepting chemotaxis protein n=1 Tax=Hahella sp. (strain CCB-MM4) TaxID=1926491 RepID=UPI000B9AF9E9|nr:methyl-accepting chemotaxis protein [Hahella sp. CCB-MM4]OZG74439.1 hypothetical protein BTA51_05365 [Hahella sp. CCB-MM4]